MGSFADPAENTTLDKWFGATDFTPAGTLYFGLSTTTVSDAGGNITEPSGGGYARAPITNNPASFPAATAGSKSNGVAVTFPVATAPWGTCTDFFVADALTGGAIICYGTLTTPKSPTNGDTASFAVGAFTITLT